MMELVKYREEMRSCSEFFKGRDYILYLIFQDEVARVGVLLMEKSSEHLKKTVERLQAEREERIYE